MGNTPNLNGRDSIWGQWNTLPYDRKVEVAKALENKDRHKAAVALGAQNVQISNAEAEKLGREMMIQLRKDAEKPVHAAVVDSEDEKTARIVQAAVAGFAQVMMAGGNAAPATIPAARPAPQQQQHDGQPKKSMISVALKAASPSALKGFITLVLAVLVVCSYLLYTQKATLDSSLISAVEEIAKARTVVLALLVSGIGVLVHFYSPILWVTKRVAAVAIGWPLFYTLALVEHVMVLAVLFPLYLTQGVRLIKLGVGGLANKGTGEFGHIKATSRWKPLAKSINYLAPTIPVALEVGEVKV